MDKMWGKWYSHMVGGNIKLSMIVPKCLGIPQMAKKDLQVSVILHTLRKKNSTCPHKHLYMSVHSSTNHKMFFKKMKIGQALVAHRVPG